MRTSRRASNAEVPSFLRQIIKETERMVAFFFKGTQGQDGDEEEEEEDDEESSAYLERPVLEKHLTEGSDRCGISYAVGSMQGWRSRMEDAHTCIPEMAADMSGWGYYAVYDGHAGNTVAEYCSRHLLDHILATGRIKAEDDPAEVKEGIREGFLNIDRHMHSLARSACWDCSGSTAAAVMLSPRHIYLINCGDSRVLLCRHGLVCFYTEDHKPCNPGEKARIQNAGGSVTLQRVNGSLAVSRALGDFDFKEVAWRPQTEQLVSPEPEVFQLERSPADEFLVVACDGVWDAMDNEELCAFVRDRMQVTDNPREVCAQVIDLCLYKLEVQVTDNPREVCAQVIDLCLYKGSLDNISIIIIRFPGAPKVSPEALQREAALEQLIESKVADTYHELRSEGQDPDLLKVMKHLTSENIPGLPPGGGITSKRDCIIVSYQKQVLKCQAQKFTLHSEKMSLGAEGDPSSGSMAVRRAAGSTQCGPGGSETVPLLIPGIVSNSRLHLAPMNKKELLLLVGSPGWRKLHALLGSLFWLGWLATVGVAIVVIAQSSNPAALRLRWWQRAPFCRLQAALFLDSGHTGVSAINEVRDRLPYLRNLGVGALILEGLFPRGLPASAIMKLNESLGTLPQFQQLLAEGRKSDMRILLDLCDLDFRDSSTLNSSHQTEESTNPVLAGLRFWLEQGVGGFSICDTDAAYSVHTLLVWRGLMRNLSQEENERILVVSKAEETRPQHNMSDPVGNHSLVDMITRSLLPSLPRPLSAQDVAVAIETHLLRPQREWPSWTVREVLPGELQNILMVLLMTLPGTPVISYGINISPSQVRRRPAPTDSALLRSLSQLRSREEALLLGNLTFLSLSNSSQTIAGSVPPPSPPILALLCSWSCTRILVLLNLSPDIQGLDPSGVRSLPAAGVFLVSTGLGRLGSCVLETLQLQPWEAVVIKF